MGVELGRGGKNSKKKKKPDPLDPVDPAGSPVRPAESTESTPSHQKPVFDNDSTRLLNRVRSNPVRAGFNNTGKYY